MAQNHVSIFQEPTTTAHFQDKPSKSKLTWWYMAHSRKMPLTKRPDPPNIGKWLIFENRKKIDEVWAKIKEATIDGKVGFASKVSTRKKKPAEIGGLTNGHVICIYTYGSEEDKKRVRDALYELGFIRRIPYKSDAATAAGVYTQPWAPPMTPQAEPDPGPSFKDFKLDLNLDFEQPSPKKMKVEAEPKKYELDYEYKNSFLQGCTKPIGVYKTDGMYNHRSYIHIKQLFPKPFDFKSAPDVHFPIEQFGQVSEAFYRLANRKPTDEGSDDKIAILSTDDVKVWGHRRADVFDGDFAIWVQHKSKKIVKFLQTDGMFCHQILEQYRQRPDVEGPDEFSSDESPDEDEAEDEGDDDDDFAGYSDVKVYTDL